MPILSGQQKNKRKKKEGISLPEMSGAFEAWLHPRHKNMPNFSGLARISGDI